METRRRIVVLRGGIVCLSGHKSLLPFHVRFRLRFVVLSFYFLSSRLLVTSMLAVSLLPHAAQLPSLVLPSSDRQQLFSDRYLY